ncbi:hypothetical protein KSW81_001792 [Nannochloris sp. 'desiccata']|nr:hypothetical protein KSW81_001792 [Chlorella desiccata (nom. nud.)]
MQLSQLALRWTVLGPLPQSGGHLDSCYRPTTSTPSRSSRPAGQSPKIRCQASATTSSSSSSFTIKSSSPSLPSAAELEAREELALRSSDAAIYGIPRSEWLALDKPARYLGNEFGSVHKPWNDAQIRFALTYPEIYEVGASNLGHIILYGLLNQEPGVLCDRAYYPGADMSAMLKRHDKKLFGVESRRSLDQFDVLGFSLSYELGGTNILDMLQMSGIPLSWEERKAAEPKGKPFDPLNEVEGVYVPQFYDAPAGWGGAVFPIKEGVSPRIRRRVCAPDPFQQIGLTPYVDTIHNRLTVEIRRGCTRGCRFCQPGMLTRPARDVEPDKSPLKLLNGVCRLRDIINKGLTNEELLRGVKTAWDRGWRQVKLYFMIGLPGETDADVHGYR